jgi:hypothetical protein
MDQLSFVEKQTIFNIWDDNIWDSEQFVRHPSADLIDITLVLALSYRDPSPCHITYIEGETILA